MAPMSRSSGLYLSHFMLISGAKREIERRRVNHFSCDDRCQSILLCDGLSERIVVTYQAHVHAGTEWDTGAAASPSRIKSTWSADFGIPGRSCISSRVAHSTSQRPRPSGSIPEPE